MTTMPWSTACLTRSWKASLPGWPMISMQFGLAASASLNWLIMVSGAQAENCSLSVDAERRRRPASAPVWRASVAPSPALPPICMYMTTPLPGSAAGAAAAAAERRRRPRLPAAEASVHVHVVPPLTVRLPRCRRPRPAAVIRPRRIGRSLRSPKRAKKALRRCGSST